MRMAHQLHGLEASPLGRVPPLGTPALQVLATVISMGVFAIP